MSDSGFQVQILVADETVTEFLADPDIKAPGIRIQDTRPAKNTATLGFDLAGAVTLINLLVEMPGDIAKLVSSLTRLLKKSRKPVVVSTAFGTVTLEPARDLTDGEIRKLLTALATL